MYLKTIQSNNFRSCETTNVEFNKDLTALVGENKAGKSNIGVGKDSTENGLHE